MHIGPLASFLFLGLSSLPVQAQAAPPDLASALAAWQAAHGESWQIVPDAGTGYAQMIYGGGRPSAIVPHTDEQFVDLARARLAETRELSGLDPETLEFARVQFMPLGQIGSTDKTVVKFQERVNGVRVVDGWTNVLFDQRGTLLSIQSSGLPRMGGFATSPSLDARRANKRAVELFRAQTHREPSYVSQAELVVLQLETDSGREGRLCWEVNVQAIAPGMEPAGFVHWLDARNGELVQKRTSIQFFDVNGTVQSMGSPGLLPDEASNPESAQTMKYLRVTSSAGTTTTDANGNFSFPGIDTPLSVTVTYDGTFNAVTNNGGPSYSLTTTLQPNQPNTLLMNPSSSATITSQANAFRAVNAERDFVRSINPTDPMADFIAAADVNQGSTCNAFYAGFNINFFAAGGGCVNTAFSTVVSHEQGHWLNDRYSTGNGGDGMGEGNADVWALYVWDTPVNGQDWSGPGTMVRTGNNTRQFCGDGSPGCYGEVHSDGEPWMGAAWKVRNRLNTAYGNSTGDLIANTIFLSWMESFNQMFIRSVIETQWLTLDDNDANIGNGTPHYTHIDGGFKDQGFPGYVIPGLAIVNVTVLPNATLDNVPYVVNATITPNTNPPLASATLKYRVEGGALQNVPMTALGGNNYTATIPGQVGPAHVEYFVSATDNANTTATWPPNGGNDFLGFDLGDRHVLILNDFEGLTDLNWTHGAIAGTDDWQHGPAKGKSGSSGGIGWIDPVNGHMSGRCWGTDLGAGGSNGAYTNNANDWLRSPIVDGTGATGLRLRFKRWLSVQGSASDQARVRVNGTQLWINPTTNLTETGWSALEYDISALADGNPAIQLEFALQTNGSTSLGGWNLDDVEVVWLTHSNQPCPLPVSYCVSAPNSFDAGGATMNYGGTSSVAANNLIVECFHTPPFKAGLFFYGQNQAQVPFGNGYRCVGNPLVRLPLIHANDLGDMFYALDLTNLPPAGQIQAGEVWNFALWYRDPDAGGANFNASNGLSVSFCP